MTSQASEKNIPVSVKQGASPIQAFQKEVNNLFRDFFGETLPHLWRPSEACMPFGACPATDVVETDKAFKIMAELPGMEAKDITVTISDNYVTIKGEKREETKEEKNGYFRQERSYGEFQRVIRDIKAGAQVEADHVIGDLIARGDAAKVPVPKLRIAYTHLKAYQSQRA